jgi:heme-degrading monooxygenase HmoA
MLSKRIAALCLSLMAFNVGKASGQSINEVKMNTLKPKPMIAVLFEVIPAEGEKQTYLDIAKDLRPALDSIDGFISIERFQSLTTPGKILSLSYWRDEEAVRQWRNTPDHRLAQQLGREKVFKDYTLRVVQVIRDYGKYDRQEAPADSKAVHDKHQE